MCFKRIAVLAVAALTISVLSGCKNAGSDSNGEASQAGNNSYTPVTITAWHYYNGVQQTKFDEMVKEFNNTEGLEKGIIVQAFSQNSVNELAENVSAALNGEAGADEAPDIFACYADTAYGIDKTGKLADISPYFTQEELDEYIPEYISEGRFDGSSLKIFPIAKSTEVLIVNDTDWKKFAASEGVTFDELKTWEGLADVSEKYYNYTDALTPDVEGDGKAFFGRDAVANYLTVGASQLGCTLVDRDADGKAVLSLDKDAMKKLWNNYYVPYVKGYYTAEGKYRSDDAKIGKVVALVCSTTGALYYPNEVTVNDTDVYPIEKAVLQVPNFEGTDPFIVQQGAGMCVTKSDERTENACATFLKWFTESERNIEFSVGSGYLPVKKEANDPEKIEKVIADKGLTIDDSVLDTIRTAIEEVRSYTLYTAEPFDNSSKFRYALSDAVELTAKNDFAAACQRISDGEDKQTVLYEYTNTEAFEKWYKQLESDLSAVIGG